VQGIIRGEEAVKDYHVGRRIRQRFTFPYHILSSTLSASVHPFINLKHCLKQARTFRVRPTPVVSSRLVSSRLVSNVPDDNKQEQEHTTPSYSTSIQNAVSSRATPCSTTVGSRKTINTSVHSEPPGSQLLYDIVPSTSPQQTCSTLLDTGKACSQDSVLCTGL
jgi:hypothetical protein